MNWSQSFIKKIQKNSFVISRLDCLLSFSNLAISKKYCRPVFDDSFDIEISEGRHPVIESQLPTEKPFIPNNILITPKLSLIHI